uniref:uncharacterized protein LOC108951000 n=1 Tax=Ciona intestinalis TaxID=7719 RepID=UPI00089DAFDC|nr:uncharacterized protein LOC108951000 [Ciona intestinalis]|eukprot:XP_018672863.1 uncharacterized protein LOC108951000 [Ciona intestinalis]
MSVRAVRQPDGSDLLRTSYFCQMNKSNPRQLNVVMEMDANRPGKSERQNTVYKRYVLVIDVSSSMDRVIDGQTTTLLQRMKAFTNLFIDKAKSTVLLGIVTFSKIAHVALGLTQMDKQGKKIAKAIVETLKVENATNISAGLFLALEMIKDRSHSRDSIIIFTDGEANCGITEAGPLITEYREKSQEGGQSCVPLSAITVEGYLPGLLYEISYHLGSDAFYWVNVQTDFEADMMIPQIIRDLTNITDVTVVATALEGTEIQPDPSYTDNEVETSIYIHSLPSDIKRNIYFCLQLPSNYKKLNGKIILRLDVRFVDETLNWRRFTDSIKLCLKPVQDEAKKQTLLCVSDAKTQKYRESVVAYVSCKNTIHTSWRYIGSCISKVYDEQCKREALRYFTQMRECIKNEDTSQVNPGYEMSYKTIKGKIEEAARCLGEKNPYSQTFTGRAKNYLGHLQYAKVSILKAGLADFAIKLWGAFAAMGSSFEKEMPTASGVFSSDLKQPFMHPIIEKKLVMFREALRTGVTTRKRLLFEGHNVILSETLKSKVVRANLLPSLLSNLGARPVNSATVVKGYDRNNPNVFMLCSQTDLNRRSQLFMDAVKHKIDIVSESYLQDCLATDEVLKRADYLLC